MAKSDSTPCLPACVLSWATSDEKSPEFIDHAPACPNAPEPKKECTAACWNEDHSIDCENFTAPAPEPQGSDARWRAEQDACEAEQGSEEPIRLDPKTGIEMSSPAPRRRSDELLRRTREP